MAKILVTEPVDISGIDLLEQHGHEVIKGWTLSSDALSAHYTDIEGILVRIAKIPSSLMESMPRLKVVAKHGVGCDNIDVAYARNHNIAVGIAASANATSVAEHTLMFILAAAKDLLFMDKTTRDDYAARTNIHAVDIQNRTVLIVGYGRIGTKVALLCKAFGMDVIIHDTKFDVSQTEVDGFKLVHDLQEGLVQADILTVHVPLTDQTHHMIAEKEMRLMKSDAIVINCARGGIVHEQDLARMLEDKVIKAAAIDVFFEEPINPENPLLKAPRCVLAPHAAAFTVESLARMSQEAAQNIMDVIEGRGLQPGYLYELEAFSQEN
jgi:D-3-phosphoglycerate dehydrogenase